MKYSRYGAALASLLISAGLAYIGHASYFAATAWAGYMVAAQSGNAIGALERNMTAHSLFPLEPAYRRQLAGTLGFLMAKHHPNVNVDPAAADLIAKVSRTVGPDDTSILIPRAEYLLNSGRWTEPEMDRLMARLAVIGGGLQSYWLLKAYWHGLRGEKEPMREAIVRGESMRPVTVEMSKFAALKAALEKAE